MENGISSACGCEGITCHVISGIIMATKMDKEKYEELKKKRAFKKFNFRGVELEKLLDLNSEELLRLLHSRARRKAQRAFKKKPRALMKKLRRAKKAAQVGEKPAPVKTHLRNMIIIPELIGSVVSVYNGHMWIPVDVRTEMVGHYLAEFSQSYKPVKHNKPGIGATHSSRFIPLK